MTRGNPVSAPSQHCVGKLTTHKVGVLLRELSDDKEEELDDQASQANPSNPWHDDFHGYLHSRDQLGTMSIVEWWGVRVHTVYWN
jgi:hypothetical protein